MKHHNYQATMTWTGNRGTGTKDYRGYDRSHTYQIKGKQVIEGSSDPAFRGDPAKYNPEELLIMALSSCHMLSYLHVCAVNDIVVTAYVDNATGVMEENKDGSGQFIGVTLNPIVTVKSPDMIEKANTLHHDASRACFIARSVNFDVQHKPLAVAAGSQEGVTV
ncbi:MAG: OsmC family protein [Chryseolinea sp.]